MGNMKPMLLTNNQRKMHGLPLWRKKNRKKRLYTRCEADETIMEILVDSMTGTDTPKAQIRRYAEDILMGRAELKGNTADGTYHLETYEPGEEEELPSGMNVWKIPQSKKSLEK